MLHDRSTPHAQALEVVVASPCVVAGDREGLSHRELINIVKMVITRSSSSDRARHRVDGGCGSWAAWGKALLYFESVDAALAIGPVVVT